MEPQKYDFSGWATRNDLRCSDGRVIRKDAFKDNDGQIVPLVWNHQHNDPLNVLGHALLKNMDDGVYAYCSFNDTENGKVGKEIVQHGDVCALSIYANKLKQNGGDVLHGMIREVSLVLAGANPGAFIDAVLEHSDDEEGEAIISVGEELSGLSLYHAEEKDDGNDSGKDEEGEKEMADKGEKTVKDVFDSFTEEQKNVVYFMIGKALEDAGVSADDEDDDEDEGEEDMKHNVFDYDDRQDSFLSHSDMQQIFSNAKRLGSLKDAVMEYTDDQGIELAHSIYNHDADGNPTTEQTYGIADIGTLFPEYKSLNNPPEFIRRNTDWVGVVMNGVGHTPFSRIKSSFADITPDEARAKGYIKGNLKKEEVFSLLKRTTDPQTIYKKQKLDRDDVIDITDFDVVAWIRREMRIMLDEEIARAILIGDGRLPSDDDHISEDHIRPIAKDSDLFTVKIKVDSDDPKAMIEAIIRNRKNYKGSGNPIFFTTEDVLTEMLLLEDGINHALYKTEAELATKLRVSRIITVPVMENQKINGEDLYGVIVNLSDYKVGADKGGSINMFDDFDIDYNQMKYLIETRCSGALVKPYSAMVITKKSE